MAVAEAEVAGQRANTSVQVARGERGRWLPGYSGNPSGRPKEVGHVRDLARRHTEDAIRTLVEIMLDPKQRAQARVQAAEALLDRAWGRPPQSVEVSGDSGLRIIITERIAAALAVGAGAKVAAVIPGAAVAGELPAGEGG